MVCCFYTGLKKVFNCNTVIEQLASIWEDFCILMNTVPELLLRKTLNIFAVICSDLTGLQTCGNLNKNIGREGWETFTNK